MKLLQDMNPWLGGALVGIAAGVILGLIFQSPVMGFTLGAGAAIIIRNLLKTMRRS